MHPVICVTFIDTIVSAMTLYAPNTAREQRSHITEHLLQEFNIYFSVSCSHGTIPAAVKMEIIFIYCFWEASKIERVLVGGKN